MSSPAHTPLVPVSPGGQASPFRRITNDPAIPGPTRHGRKEGGMGRAGAATSPWVRLLILLLPMAVLVASLPPTAIARPRPHGVEGEVVGGHAVPKGEHTFMAFIEIDIGRGRFIACGGSLIAPRFVLTAAHCVDKDDGSLYPSNRFTVIIGRVAVGGRVPAANLRHVVAVTPHPDWNPDTSQNDAAVLTLDKAVAAKVADPLAIASDARFDHAGQVATVAGWGRTRENGKPSNRLNAANLTVDSDATCAQVWDDSFDPAVELCASFPGKDACYGDSGGPLFASVDVPKERGSAAAGGATSEPDSQDVAIGIVSFGSGCARPGVPGVYTRLSAPSIHDFILDVING